MSTHKAGSERWNAFRRQRDGNKHIDNCKSGYMVVGLREVHHLLCVHACSDPSAAAPPGVKTEETVNAEELAYIHQCLQGTTWDINAEHNVIGLPKKKAYSDHKEGAGAEIVAAGKKPELTSWNKLPCHMVDHNPYHTTEVCLWTRANIWIPLKRAKAERDCKAVEPAGVLAMFRTGSEHFRRELNVRGQRKGGAAAMIAAEFADKEWFHPFSMAETPNPRLVPKSGGATLHELLKKIVDPERANDA